MEKDIWSCCKRIDKVFVILFGEATKAFPKYPKRIINFVATRLFLTTRKVGAIKKDQETKS